MTRRFPFQHPRIAIVLSLIVVMTLLGLPALSQAEARDDCTLETIQGTYLFHGAGSIVEEGEVRTYAEAGVWTLDGNGNATGMISGSIGGEAFATREPFTATYDHVGDCVYAVSDEFGLQLDLYATPSGATMTYFSPGFSGIHLRQ